MGLKGSKYARKHQTLMQEKPAEGLLMHTTENQEKDKDIWDILYNPDGFMNKFLELPYPRQIAMVELLHNISKNPGTTSLENEFSMQAEKHLRAIHIQTNSSYDEGTYYAVADDEKRLVRMECYGTINKRKSYQLSTFYKFFNQPENRGKFKLKDYDLSTSPSWRVFNQFESFRSIAPQIRRYLYKKSINPDILKVATINDYCDIIYQTFKKSDSEETVHFLKTGKAIKNRVVMDFMKHCGEIFEHRLLEKGNDPRCVKSLCNMMRRFGVCDLSALTVTETHFTPRILEDLAREKYDVSQYKAGEPIEQSFIDELADANKEYLLAARNPDGSLLDKKGLPQLEDHHKNAVRFAANEGYLAKVNYPNNHMLVDSQMHRSYYHLFDVIMQEKNTEKFYSRLNVNSRIMCLAIGFELQDAVYYDFENSAAFRRRQEKDTASRVNYFSMMEERLLNEQKIAEKYHIQYARTGIANAARAAKEISGQPEYDKEKMKIFQKWLNNQRKGRHKGK